MYNRLLAFFGIKPSFSMNPKNYFKMFLRAIGLTRPIELSREEIQWIKLCKFHYFPTSTGSDRGRFARSASGEWTDTLKPLFNETYGWTAEEFPADYLDCMFHKLLDIWLKIKHDQSGHDRELKEIFRSAFYKNNFSRSQEKPIERAIAELCGLIQNNLVIKNGVHRYHLPNDPKKSIHP